jgi:hypothetical protein
MTHWPVIDPQSGFAGPQEIPSESLGSGAAGSSISVERLTGGKRDGVDRVRVNNGRLSFDVLPTRGLGVHRAMLRRDVGDDLPIGWQAPVRGPVHPNFVPVAEPSGIGWLDGFDELFVRCGLNSNGAPDFDEHGRLTHGLHGKIANTPAHEAQAFFDEREKRIGVTGSVDESRLFFSKLRLSTEISAAIGEPGFRVRDTVTNLSAEPGSMQLLYHVNFGAPLCVPGARVAAPVKKLAPRGDVAAADLPTWDQCGPETPGSAESVFFMQLHSEPETDLTSVALIAPGGDLGVRLTFSTAQLPWFIVWKNRQAAEDGYVTGLEPAVNLPNPHSFERAKGRVAELAPQESRSFEVHLEVLDGTARVTAALAEIDAIQDGQVPDIRNEPNPDWSAP